jgi:hypothetical protein
MTAVNGSGEVVLDGSHKPAKKKLNIFNALCGTAGGIRTTDLLIHSQAL